MLALPYSLGIGWYITPVAAKVHIIYEKQESHPIKEWDLCQRQILMTDLHIVLTITVYRYSILKLSK